MLCSKTYQANKKILASSYKAFMCAQNELPFTFSTDLIIIKVLKDRDSTTAHKKF